MKNYKMKTSGAVVSAVINDISDYISKVQPQPSPIKLDDLTIDTLYKETYLHQLRTIKAAIEKEIENVSHNP